MVSSRLAPYPFHKPALLPVLDSILGKKSYPGNTGRMCDRLGPEFIEFLINQGLSGHWYYLLTNLDDESKPPESITQVLEKQIKYNTAVYLVQLKTVYLIHKLLHASNIKYAIYKGAHVREELYSPPSIRYAQDIDILISPDDRSKVITLLIKEGFTPYYSVKNVTSEVNLYTDYCSIDLHWNLLRHGRSKIDLIEPFLANRVNRNGFYSMNNEHTLVVMLVHPVFRKYLTTPHAYLARIVDIYGWINSREIDWDSVVALLTKSHLKTAAWLTVYYCQFITEIPFPDNFLDAIKPGKLKELYLTNWIHRNLSSKYLTVPLLPQFFFTLPAQDNLRDVVSLLLSIVPQKMEAKKLSSEINSIVESSDNGSSIM